MESLIIQFRNRDDMFKASPAASPRVNWCRYAHKKKIRVQKTGEFSIPPSRGAEGVRTLVQLCAKLCLLHAYFPVNCRDQAGWKPTLPFSLGALVSQLYHTLQLPAMLFRCP